ncbi:pentatricopeptide repeat-containing protein At5g56310 [Mercurialis annua]|uniref:pentatricopeptide repeat-containing protein At5g56310 n=1 Tax=Mercurialis annua TaxID=3986 RepID=UPI00215E1395|nr:pentatricopeptide repeat-containing protein At5g56310 [Mercurialis annua]XP_050218549.1 pentatricopeptide repeat-containing protein At5g56310 [Mercurialis annua]XP_050218550.1 pentatricopeptide repeat-containing protein At5g56310 [Mercurialis annua]
MGVKQLVSEWSSVKQFHAWMIRRGVDDLYACSLLSNHKNPADIDVYNSLIRALSSASPQPALLLFNAIQLAGLRPDSYSFPFAFKAVIRLLAFPTGLQLHSQTIRFGFHSQPHVLASLIHFYSSSAPHHIFHARTLFHQLSLPTAHMGLCNSMLAAYARLGDMQNARHLFDSMPHRNVISWTSLISGYARLNRPHQAIAIFRSMQLHNVEPDGVSMVAALSACAQLGALELGEWIHNYIHKHALPITPSLSNALIDMYAKSGSIKRALLVFESMRHKTIISWTTMIAGLALHGLGTQALHMFSRMETHQVKPNQITFLAVLSACAHIGLVQLGRSFFHSMTSTYGIQPRIEHYGCMIDLLGRAGYLQEAQELLLHMPCPPNAPIWGALLAASYTHGDVVLGEHALHHLIELEPNNSGNYALLSNLYASVGRWKECRVMRKTMRDKGVKKMAGGSSIEVNNKVNEFIAGETSHPQFHELFQVLCNINGQLRLSELWEKQFVEFGEEIGCTSASTLANT